LPGRGAGVRYLAERNNRFVEKDTRCEHASDATGRLRAAFPGLFVRCEHEPATHTGSMLSLHFLVRRADQDRFQGAFRELQQTSADKLLLTGPWPPYHFVTVAKDGDACDATLRSTIKQIDPDSCSRRELKP
jgi:hypothetical protein